MPGRFELGRFDPGRFGVVAATTPAYTSKKDSWRFDMPELIIGTDASEILTGGPGDTLVGGRGDDTFIVNYDGMLVQDLFDAGRGGYDTVFTSVSYDLRNASVEVLSTSLHAGTAAINLTGNEIAQLIIGNYGNNVLTSNGGGDTLIGFLGDDTYVVREGDQIVERAGEGTDTVTTSTNYSLGADVSVERLSGYELSRQGIVLSGNRFAQAIAGGGGADTLNGNGGADTLAGGAGDDVYRLYGEGDSVIEREGGGTDTVYTSATYVLTAGNSVETLAAALGVDTAPIALVGNEIAQTLVGNYGANVLNGGGAAAGDTLIGLLGDDTYRVYGLRDSVVEGAGGGNDAVFTSADYRLAAGVSVETLSTVQHAATDAINLFGNEGANLLIGNAGANLLDGGVGADTLTGFAGADTFRFTNAPVAGVVDRITDYGNGADVIQLDAAAFGLAAGALPAGALALGTSARDADDRILYDAATGTLAFDADGSGSGAAIAFAQIGAGLTLADLRITVASTGAEGVVGITTPGTYLLGNATGAGISLAALYPAASGFNFSLPLIDYEGAFNLVFGPNTANGGAPTISFGDGGVIQGAIVGAFDFSQLGQGIVARGAGFLAADGTLITTEPPLGTGAIVPYAPRLVIGTEFGDVITRPVPTNIGPFGFPNTGTIRGGGGNDTLSGGRAMDGGDGDDRIIGAYGQTLTGGAGADTFVLPNYTRTPGTNAQTSPATLTDFNPAQDRIELVLAVPSSSVFPGFDPNAGLTPGALDPSRFAIGTAATTPDQRIIYDPATGNLYFDANGSNGDVGAAIPLFAVLPPALDLTPAAFTLVAV